MFYKKISLTLFLVLLVNFFALSQNNILKHRIVFTDKNNSPFSITQPTDFLSQKAIDRRNKQGISIEKNDLPVNPAYVDSIKSTGVEILNKSKWFNSVTIQTSDSLVIDKICWRRANLQGLPLRAVLQDFSLRPAAIHTCFHFCNIYTSLLG